MENDQTSTSTHRAGSVVSLDLRIGGNGDNWMRLTSLYTAAALRPNLKIECVLPKMFGALAPLVLGDRLDFIGSPGASTLTYTNRGLKDLLQETLRGRRFVVPYHRVVIVDWAKNSLKDRCNVAFFSLLNRTNRIQLPPWESLKLYQGYLEIVSVAALRDISWEEWLAQGEKDFDVIFERMSGEIPTTPGWSVPAEVRDGATVFPSGTGHQFMPVEWAQQHLPNAYYCFYKKDAEQEKYREAGLKIVNFHEEPGDVIALSRASRWSVSTDSFASHLLQFSTERVTLSLAEFPRWRTVTPFFRGVIADSAAPCCPCPHLERSSFPLCKAGHRQCVTWDDVAYTKTIEQTANI